MRAVRELNGRYPGFKSRIVDEQSAIAPPHREFMNQNQTHDLGEKLDGTETHIICALSKG